MKKLQVVTNSEITCLDECRAKQGFAYIERLRPLVTPAPFRRGHLYHLGLKMGWLEAWSAENWHLPLVERVELAKRAAVSAIAHAEADAMVQLETTGAGLEAQDELTAMAQIATWGCKRYFTERQNDLDPARFLPLAIEKPFSIRLKNAAGNVTNVVYEGVIDLVLLDLEANMLRIEDDKMGKSISDYERKLDLDTQTTGYLVAVRELQEAGLSFWGVPAGVLGAWSPSQLLGLIGRANTGVVAFNVMRGVIPANPTINKDGHVSVAQCATTAEIYGQALVDQVVERNLEITEKQREFCDKLKLTRWFAQLEFMRGDDEVERWRAETLVKAKLIREMEKHPELRVRQPGHCTSPSAYACAYKAVCMDPTSEAVRKSSYRVATDSHEEVAEARDNGSEEKQGFSW